MAESKPGADGRAGEQPRPEMNAGGDAREPLGPVPDGVEARDHREQDLGGADVRGRLLAADMLLAGLEREAHRRPAGRIHAHADEPARHLALEAFAGCEKSRVRAAEPHRHAEALRRSDDDVRAHGTWRLECHECERIGGDDREPACPMHGGDLGREIAQRAVRGGILQQHREGAGGGDRFRIARSEIGEPPSVRACAGRRHRARLRMDIGCDKEDIVRTAGERVGHRHRLGRGGGLVEQRGVGDLHAREIDDHGLEVEQRLEPALRDLRLVGRIGGVPARILEDVAADHRRHVSAVIALPDQRFLHDVAGRERGELRHRLRLAERGGKIELLRAAADRGGQRARDEVLEILAADGGEHRSDLGFVRADMAGREGAAIAEGGEPGERFHQSVSRKALYAASSIRSAPGAATSAATFSRRKNQPSPAGSRLTSEGSSTIAALTSATRPATGA